MKKGYLLTEREFKNLLKKKEMYAHDRKEMQELYYLFSVARIKLLGNARRIADNYFRSYARELGVNEEAKEHDNNREENDSK